MSNMSAKLSIVSKSFHGSTILQLLFLSNSTKSCDACLENWTFLHSNNKNGVKQKPLCFHLQLTRQWRSMNRLFRVLRLEGEQLVPGLQCPLIPSSWLVRFEVCVNTREVSWLDRGVSAEIDIGIVSNNSLDVIAPVSRIIVTVTDLRFRSHSETIVSSKWALVLTNDNSVE